MTRWKKKYESEVHLGLLGILCILLSLNFVSNYALHRARTMLQAETAERLRSASVIASRTLGQPNQTYPLRVPQSIVDSYGLKSASLFAGSPRTQDDWSELIQSQMTSLTDSTMIRKLAGRLHESASDGLIRWNEHDYLMVSDIRIGGQPYMFVALIEAGLLSMLQDASNIILYAGLAGIILIAITYLFVSRIIFRPFKQLRDQAAAAGRPVNGGEDEVAALVKEYRFIIDELRANQTELIRLHADVSTRAASLESFNSLLVETIAAGVVVLDLDGDIHSINASAEQLLGDAAHSNIFPQELLANFPELLELIASSRKNRAVLPYQEIERMYGSTWQAIGVSISFIRDESSTPVAMVVLLHDVTELHRLRKEIESRERLSSLGEMAAGLAHQLRNALGAIRGFATLLKKQATGAGLLVPQREQIDAVLDESRQAEALINRFLSFSRPLHLQCNDINVSALLESALQAVASRHTELPGSLENHIQPNLTCFGDSTLLRQVVENLLENAIEASRQSNSLPNLIARSEGDAILILVRDRGVGMSTELQQKLFTPFVSTRPDGTGLGLSIAKKIVDLHGGTIRVASEVGKGTTFFVSLPLRGAPVRMDNNFS